MMNDPTGKLTPDGQHCWAELTYRKSVGRQTTVSQHDESSVFLKDCDVWVQYGSFKNSSTMASRQEYCRVGRLGSGGGGVLHIFLRFHTEEFFRENLQNNCYACNINLCIKCLQLCILGASTPRTPLFLCLYH